MAKHYDTHNARVVTLGTGDLPTLSIHRRSNEGFLQIYYMKGSGCYLVNCRNDANQPAVKCWRFDRQKDGARICLDLIVLFLMGEYITEETISALEKA